MYFDKLLFLFVYKISISPQITVFKIRSFNLIIVINLA